MPDATPPNPPQPPNNDGSGLPPRLLAKLKVEIEGYELIDRLGEGGQATVYKAIQKKDGQTVAVKVLHAGPHATEEARARLKREINALRAINHPNIVQAIAAGRTRSGLDCLVMNFIDGRPLDDLWNDSAFAVTIAPQPADLLRLFKTICETVQAAHRKGITHRDLSPSNILIDARGQPHILDFGMASTAFDGIVTRNVTVTGQFIGKLRYASPEQASGARTPGANGEAAASGVDIRSDVYALGVMLYQLLTGGAFPYEVVGNVIDVLNNIIKTKPKPPSEAAAELRTPTAAMVVRSGGKGVPPVTQPPVAADSIRRNPPLVNETIEAIVLKALEKDPARRYQSAGELAADIDRYLAGQPTSAVVWSKHATPASSSRPFRRAVAVAASVVLVATLIGVTMNAKSLAVWLGLATAAAPVLPTELAPLAPSTAEAAMLAAQQPDGSERRLNDLAADLAKADARLRAVHRQLAASTPRKPPELEDRQPGGSGPFPADEFLSALARSSSDTGRPLTFEPLPKADRDRAEQQEASGIERETDQAALLARRATLDAEQGGLWARLAWGTFTGREADRLFRFRLKTDPTADAGTANKGRVLEAGVKVRRLAARAMDDAATALRASGGGEGGAAADLGTIASTLAEQMRAELANFQKIAGAARDSGALKAEEAAAVAELQKHADRLRDALDGTAELQARAAAAADELERFTARDRLQRDLRDVADAAARLDAGLVRLAGEWKFDVDPTAPLRDAAPSVVRRPQPPVRQPAPVRADDKAVAVEDQFPKGSKWEGTWTNAGGRNPISGEVIDVTGDRVTLQIVNQNGTRQLILEVTGSEVRLVESPIGRGHDGGALAALSNININGRINGRRLTLSGTWTWADRFGKSGTETINYSLERKGPDAPRSQRSADPLDAWQVGSRWTTLNPSGGGVTVWSVRSRNGNQLEIQRPSVQGNGFVVVQLTVARDGDLTVTQVRHQDTPGAVLNRDWGGSGRLTANSLRLNYYSHSSNNAGRTFARWDESINLKPE
jgi:serine/threonine protein kinase